MNLNQRINEALVASRQLHADESTAYLQSLLADTSQPVEDQRVFESCANLPTPEYDRMRKPLARRLNIRPATLDKEVESARGLMEVEEHIDTIAFADDEPWPEGVNGPEILDMATQLFRRFIIFKHEHEAYVVALWALGSYLYDEFNIFPRLGFTSPLPECGKTTALDVLGSIARHAVRSDNITTAVAFRIMELHPTLLLDELDTFFRENPELVGVLNSGHRKGGSVFRVEKINERQTLTKFPTYGPVAYGMIGQPTGALFSRTLFIRLERKDCSQQTEDFNPEESPALSNELTSLRRKLARWAEDHRAEVKAAQPDTAKLANRMRDNWRPLLKIAQALGEPWPAHALEAAGIPAPHARETDNEKLLRDIRNIFYTRQVDQLPTELLLKDLNKQEESGWYRYHHKREPLDAGDLANLLKDFNIRPRPSKLSKELQQRLFGEVRNKKIALRGYALEQFQTLFQKYLDGEPEQVELAEAVASHF